MRTKERFTKRIVIPVVATLFIALIINFVIHKQVEDDQAADSYSLQEMAQADVAYSAENAQRVAADLRNAVESIEGTARAEGEEPHQFEQIAQRRAEVEQKIRAVSEATEDNWEERRRAAYEELLAYANAVGAEALDPSANRGQ